MDEGSADAYRVRDAAPRGFTGYDTRRILARPFWGIRAGQVDESVLGRCRQFQPRLPAGAFYSHSTAALLWGLTLPPWLEAESRLHVSILAGHRAVDAAQIIGHEVKAAPFDVTEIAGLPVSVPGRLWRELAGTLSLADLVALGDELIHHRRPVCARRDLVGAVEARRYRGRRNVVAALPLLSDRAESRPESLMRFALQSHGVPRMLVNADVTTADGRFVARPDIRFADYPVAVEYDGDGHRTDKAQWRRDVGRLSELTNVGLDVVRATGEDLPDFRTLVARTKAALRRRGWTP
jgi:hypothetical protein